ncbi:class I adenylate-forming enzyme family protein [Ramlibacter sp. WS9]|uniref:class I adenylate-forming enzyme family protein n=1 Tax=Ramlibacter sp. WS9 TaxID=1882741 RepID=UPI0013050944|nr:AMP-binding protein [Ramlibacter sp. WS9]
MTALRVDRFVDAIAATDAGGATVALLAEDGEALTYADLAARVDACARSLADAGLAAGQRAVLVGENSVDMIVVLLAAMRLGAWAVPLNARMSASEIDGICAHCAPRLAYFSAGSPEAVAHALRHGAMAGSADGLSRGLVALREDGTQADGGDDVAVMIYTSGSTGTPKGVMLTHANLDFVTQASLAQEVLLPGDRIFHALPISHSFGLISALLCGLRAGATFQLATRFSAEQLGHAILHDGITVFQGVPAMYARLVEWSTQAGVPLTPNRLRMAYIGGSQIDATKKAQTEALLGIRLHHGYGLTESAPAATRTFGHPPPSDVTAGWPIPGIEVVLRDELGHDVAPGARGEVCIRGPNVMKGYFRDPEQTRAAIDAHGWLHTGDIGVFGPEGDLTIVGRIKDMIIRGGFNVYPAEVEAAIGGFAGVAQSAVLGRPLDGDEEVVAFIEPQAGARIDTEALERFLRGKLAPYKIPRRYVLMERLPASGTGKLLKAALKPLLEPGAAIEASR